MRSTTSATDPVSHYEVLSTFWAAACAARGTDLRGQSLVNLVVLVAAPLIGYGFAWVGHFFFEHNKPATFRQPWYSLAGDWVLWWQITTRRRSLSGRE
jgi:hypothetical protein